MSSSVNNSTMLSSKLFFAIVLALLSISRPTVSQLSPITTEVTGVTKATVERIVYKWTIQDFDLLPHSTGEYIHSPLFTTAAKDMQWKLRLYPRGRDQHAMDYATVFLFLHSYDENVNSNRPIAVNATLSVIKGDKLCASKILMRSYRHSDGHGYDKLIERSGLQSTVNEPLIIQAEISMALRAITKSVITILT